MSDTDSIKIPPHASVLVAGEPWTFLQSLDWVIKTNPQFNGDGNGIRASIRILKAFGIYDVGDRPKDVGDVVPLKSDDKKMMAVAFDKPAAGYIPPLSQKLPDGTSTPVIIPGFKFIGYVDAVCGEEG